ncbi:group II intron reverse transcriptase/maturase [Streptomyces sp. KMM 9044]|uniref:group II intron reverse transcriptase/maturase n=1 Tax=Streptomyces sp. KMM 9044 TaxID=2744474 RepID=UPI002151581D|nr:group II intron reverse transcriptase/maturase [Streptomyces sp. KMM 9044]WAX77163.1 group II intron reverse transcriptase/maturase [Streptomyces sp. KMM 9044]
MNTDELEHAVFTAERRVLKIQAKLHRWARDDPRRRFGDLFNLVADPAFLLVAWDRVSGNKGAKTAGVDGRTARSIEAWQGVEEFLDGLRSSIKDRSFRPLPVRERMIPKAGGKLRRLGIPTVADRVVQASLKLVLEPIFEADFLPCSYGFRPKRRAHDAVAEVRYLASRPRNYEWIVEGDIKACFDEIDHAALMDRVRHRVGDKRVLALVKAFLKAGVLTEDRLLEETTAGTPQGGILSPLLANIALSALDEHIAQLPGGPVSSPRERERRLRRGLPTFRLVRYADDWCLMVHGTKADAEALREEAARALAPMGLRLSGEKTLITHIEDGVDFLGWRIQRHRKRGTDRYYVYTYPSKKAVMAAKRKIKTLCRQVEVNQPLDDLLRRLNVTLRGWCGYFRPGVSSSVFAYLNHYLWETVWRWLRRKHRRSTWKELRHRYCGGGWWPATERRELIDLEKVGTTRYRYRGSIIPSPWPVTEEDTRHESPAGLVESPVH